jgi:hypothetical protein
MADFDPELTSLLLRRGDAYTIRRVTDAIAHCASPDEAKHALGVSRPTVFRWLQYGSISTPWAGPGTYSRAKKRAKARGSKKSTRRRKKST